MVVGHAEPCGCPPFDVEIDETRLVDPRRGRREVKREARNADTPAGPHEGKGFSARGRDRATHILDNAAFVARIEDDAPAWLRLDVTPEHDHVCARRRAV